MAFDSAPVVRGEHHCQPCDGSPSDKPCSAVEGRCGSRTAPPSQRSAVSWHHADTRLDAVSGIVRCDGQISFAQPAGCGGRLDPLPGVRADHAADRSGAVLGQPDALGPAAGAGGARP
eukprot:gene58613-80272_t